MFTLIEFSPYEPLIESYYLNVSIQEAIDFSKKPNIGVCYLVDLEDGNVFSVQNGELTSESFYKKELTKPTEDTNGL